LDGQVVPPAVPLGCLQPHVDAFLGDAKFLREFFHGFAAKEAA
jgi:hypothetical protein